MKRKMLQHGFALIIAIGFLAACKEEGAAERAGKKVDEAAKDVGKSLENAGKELQKK